MQAGIAREKRVLTALTPVPLAWQRLRQVPVNARGGPAVLTPTLARATA